MQRIAMIGFGEAARAFTSGWGARAREIAAHDLRAADPAMLQAAEAAGITCHPGPEAALSGAGIAFCLVTADQALAAAEAPRRRCRPACCGLTAIPARPAPSGARPR
ncbi:hypothetical protein [Paracoccus thiocyanatus]|uniref:hypothetical protein n=1 Tax=Paracoccus thiocyanatus TaxID=34006 RepID=UPI001C6EF4DC|nr:hypothetical protein [Paracoccus thiocyanatus]